MDDRKPPRGRSGSRCDVVMICASPLDLLVSPTQPLPNCLAPASLNLLWKFLKLPKVFPLTSAIGP